MPGSGPNGIVCIARNVQKLMPNAATSNSFYSGWIQAGEHALANDLQVTRERKKH
jgi:hypothetical protein